MLDIVMSTIASQSIGKAMKLQQVLINILSNAIKFTQEGGKVTFSASQRRKTKNDASLRFIVNDTGVGMNEEFLPHLFELFTGIHRDHLPVWRDRAGAGHIQEHCGYDGRQNHGPLH